MHLLLEVRNAEVDDADILIIWRGWSQRSLTSDTKGTSHAFLGWGGKTAVAGLAAARWIGFRSFHMSGNAEESFPQRTDDCSQLTPLKSAINSHLT